MLRYNAPSQAVSRQGEVNDASFVWNRRRRPRAGRVAWHRCAGPPGCATAGWRRSAAAATDRTFRCSRRTSARPQVLQAMQAFSAALGVTCVHCHVFNGPGDPMNDFAGDTKPTKNVAQGDDADGAGDQSDGPEGRTDEGHRSSRGRRLRNMPSRQGDSGGRARFTGCAASASWSGPRAAAAPAVRLPPGRGRSTPNSQRPNAQSLPTPNAQLNVVGSWQLGVVGNW